MNDSLELFVRIVGYGAITTGFGTIFYAFLDPLPSLFVLSLFLGFALILPASIAYHAEVTATKLSYTGTLPASAQVSFVGTMFMYAFVAAKFTRISIPVVIVTGGVIAFVHVVGSAIGLMAFNRVGKETVLDPPVDE